MPFQILIPMGGAGSRFSVAGYDKPKPFIKFHNKTMIENVIENLGVDNYYTLITQESHYQNFKEVYDNISNRVLNFNTRLLSGITQGAAESCLLAREYVNQELPLMIANCDQMIDLDMTIFYNWFINSKLDGAIMTFNSQSIKNSYAAIDSNNYVIRTAEKEVISKYATNGIYVWKNCNDFFNAAEEMIGNNIRVNNEFYVAPVFNINISWGQKIGIYHIDGHWPIGTPEDLQIYLDNKGK